MSFKVVMIVPHPMLPHSEEAYREIGAEFITRPCHTEDEIIAAAQDADVVLTMMGPMTRKVIERLDRCKLIYNIGTGYEAIDLEAATEHGICVSYPDGYCTEEVAEHAIAFILACARKLFPLFQAVKAGKWASYEKKEIRYQILPPMFPVKGQTLGIIGFGRIGRRVAVKARGLEMRVIVFDPYLSSEAFADAGVAPVTLDYLVENADFISVHAAFAPEAKHLLRMAHFRKMKSTAYLINCARADFIDEPALYQALTQGVIAGAALDVLQAGKIDPDNPLLELENLIITPHTAHYSEESKLKALRRPYEEIARMHNGEWPQWLINTAVKEKYLHRWGKLSL